MGNLTKVIEKLGFSEEKKKQAFEKILEITECFPSVEQVFETPIAALDELINATQEKWLRKASLERYELEDDAAMQNKREELMEQFKELGLLTEVKPSHNNYDYALLLGALESRVYDRFNYLKLLWEQGTRFSQLVLLGSERPLIKGEEDMATELGEKATEFNMLKAIFEKEKLLWPQDLASVPVTDIDTPLHKDGKRPSTSDTVESWLLRNPNPGHVLAVSNQPFTGYQNTVLSNNLPHGFILDTVGSAAEKDIKLSVILDSLARHIFTARPRLESALEEPLQEESQENRTLVMR